MSCINIYHPDYIKLLSEIDDSIIPFELPTLIRLYQKMNNTDKIPSVSEIYEIDNRTKSQEIPNQIQEVFNENPELANTYEALGFKNVKPLSKENTEKVDKIFKKYPELETLFNNNKELYNSYIESIFPNSSKEFKGELFFHGTKNPIEGGKFKISDKNLAKGLWFTKQLGYAKRIQNYKNEGDTPITYGVVLNISNPKHFYNSSGALLVQRPSDFENQYDRKNNDAAVFHHPESSDGKFTNQGGYNQIVVFDENRVHIIGDENDINKAKEFLANQITPEQKQQATFMFSEFLDVYLQDFEQVEKILKEENIIEKDCSGGGKLKAEKGLQTNFTKGGKWKIYEIFEGKSHKQGGIDINIKNNQISFTNKNGSIKAKYGLVISKDN